MKRALDILFVGNSYTYFNDMPVNYFKKMAEDSGYEVTVTAVTKGGAYLSEYADEEHSHGQMLREAVGGRHFDVAVIQEQSVNPIRDEERFINGVRDVSALIDADNFVLYATWGRNDDSPTLSDLGMTRAEMTERLSTAYNKAARLFGMSVAEVGRAFLEHESKDELYSQDKSHPSAIGSELAARVIFEAVEKCTALKS